MTKIAYFDCFSGISGDMILGALFDLGLDYQQWQKELEKLKLSDFSLEKQKVVKNHIAATKFSVVNSSKHFRYLDDISKIIKASSLKESIKEKSLQIFLEIARAESKIHNQPLEKVHFHEIGAVDTIVDVVGTLIALDLLGIEKVYCSKINVGTGFIKFSHGTFPVPAPATVELLKEATIYASDCKAELVTPTGAAIIASLSDHFAAMPEMKLQKIGYGAGTKDLEHPNVLRIFLGLQERDHAQQIYTMETNIDDMNPELYGHVIEKLMDAGALDVFLTPIQMKKNRPGIKLTVLTAIAKKEELLKIIFQETTSIGVRMRLESREILTREIKKVDTVYGPVRFKFSYLSQQLINEAPEYEDCRQISLQQKIPLKQVYRDIQKS